MNPVARSVLEGKVREHHTDRAEAEAIAAVKAAEDEARKAAMVSHLGSPGLHGAEATRACLNRSTPLAVHDLGGPNRPPGTARVPAQSHPDLVLVVITLMTVMMTSEREMLLDTQRRDVCNPVLVDHKLHVIWINDFSSSGVPQARSQASGGSGWLERQLFGPSMSMLFQGEVASQRQRYKTGVVEGGGGGARSHQILEPLNTILTLME